MGMSTHVLGIKPSNEKHKKMLEVYKNCMELNIFLPREVYDYFECCEPDELGVTTIIKSKEYFDNGRQGIEITIDELDKDIKIIRFFNYW